jgi:hypothetical protein
MQELNKKKKWYQSKTILATVGTIAAAITANPPQSKQDWLQTGIIIGGGLLTAAFRKQATTKL